MSDHRDREAKLGVVTEGGPEISTSHALVKSIVFKVRQSTDWVVLMRDKS